VFDQELDNKQCASFFASLPIPDTLFETMMQCYTLSFGESPSLFLDPKGVQSGLHIDDGGTSFWSE
jgi:hypothetical protein